MNNVESDLRGIWRTRAFDRLEWTSVVREG